jgi:hypothetical protein
MQAAVHPAHTPESLRYLNRPAIIKQLRTAGFTQFSILMMPDGAKIDVGGETVELDNLTGLEAWRRKRAGEA